MMTMVIIVITIMITWEKALHCCFRVSGCHWNICGLINFATPSSMWVCVPRANIINDAQTADRIEQTLFLAKLTAYQSIMWHFHGSVRWIILRSKRYKCTSLLEEDLIVHRFCFCSNGSFHVLLLLVGWHCGCIRYMFSTNRDWFKRKLFNINRDDISMKIGGFFELDARLNEHRILWYGLASAKSYDD